MKENPVPALTVWQPWAELIVSGRKPIEIRRWSPEYRGRVWIHAGLHDNHAVERRFGFSGLFRGGYIGSAELSSVEPFTEGRWASWQSRHLDSGPYQPGLFAWVFIRVRRFLQPISGPGQQSLFVPGPEILLKLEEADSVTH